MFLGKLIEKLVLNYLKLLRIHQWVKNLFIFTPVFFSKNIFNSFYFLETLKGFILFCLAASAIYIFNDIKDVNSDKLHPQKKLRPIAAGFVNVKICSIVAVLLVLFSISMAYLLNISFGNVLISYVLINIFYSSGLKNIPVLDLFIIATGFVLRVFAGGVITGVHISDWIIILTFLLAVFIAMSKRYNDLLIPGEVVRESVKLYNVSFVTQALTFLLAIVFVSYLLFTMSEQTVQNLGSKNLYITSIFVLFGFIRYLQITLVEKRTAEPTKIFLTDKPLLLSAALWILTFGVLIY